jgi:hypothetical protein
VVDALIKKNVQSVASGKSQKNEVASKKHQYCIWRAKYLLMLFDSEFGMAMILVHTLGRKVLVHLQTLDLKLVTMILDFKQLLMLK